MDLEFHAQWANGNYSRTAVKLSYVKQAISNKVLPLVETKANRIYVYFSSVFIGVYANSNYLHFFLLFAEKYRQKFKFFFHTYFQNCSDLLWENVIEKNFWNSRLKAENLEITRTIYSNSARSEQFLKQTFSCRFLS